MKKILLSIAAVFLTLGAMAQSTLEFTFNRSENTVTAELDGEVKEEISATIAINPNAYLSSSDCANNSILAINRNTNVATADDPNCYTLTISGLGNCTFTGITVGGVAVNSAGKFQGMDTNRDRNFVIGYGADANNLTNTDPLTKRICDNAHCNGTPTEHTFTVEGTASDNLVIKVKIYTDGGAGCFYGLTSISINGLEQKATPEAAFYHLSGKNLTAAELMEKTEPTYIAIKGLAQGNNVYYNYVTNATNTSQELYDQTNIFVWEPVTAGTKGSYYLRKLNAGYMQTSAPGDFADSKENAIVFTAVKPAEVASGASGSGQFNRDANSDGYITAAGGYDYIVRFVAGSNWLNIGAHVTSAKSPAYTNNGYGTYTIYQICELKGFDENVNVTIKNTGDVDFATFYSNAPVQMPEGVTAYYVKEDGINDGYITLAADEDGIIAGNTGVILSTTADADAEVALTVLGANVAAENGNLLKGTAEDEIIIKEDGKEYYVLADGEIGIGLYVAGNGGDNTTFKNWANKAYLVLPKVNNVASYSFRFPGTTAIENVEVENEVKAIFDLTGRRVEAITAPGIYIINGKKVLVK